MSDPTTTTYQRGTLWVGTIPLAFPGYAVRRTGDVVIGWRQATPGVEIRSIEHPFDRPTIRAVVFSPREPVKRDPARLLLTAHETVGLLTAPRTLEGTVEGDERTCCYSVVEGPVDIDPRTTSVSAAAVAFGGEQLAVGVAMSRTEREDLEEMIVRIAERLAS